MRFLRGADLSFNEDNNSYKYSITEKLFELSNICISTISFTIIMAVLLLYSLDKIGLPEATKYIFYLLIVFVMDQIFIKPLLGFIEKNSNAIKKLCIKAFPRIFE